MTIDRSEDAATGPGFRPPRGFLSGRTALVTGAARRVGRTLALALAHEGAVVVLHFHTSKAEAEDTAVAISEQGGICHVVQCDLAVAEAAVSLVEKAGAMAARPIDILVNNAAIFAPASARQTTAAAWDRFQAVNLRAPMLLARGLARQLPAGVDGDVINLGDLRALRPGSDHPAYTASKVGLHGLTRSLALALAPQVRVNELLLGPVLPPEVPGGDYEHVPRESLPTRRFPTPDDVAGGMLFFLGNSAVTGQSLCVDGGGHLL